MKKYNQIDPIWPDRYKAEIHPDLIAGLYLALVNHAFLDGEIFLEIANGKNPES